MGGKNGREKRVWGHLLHNVLKCVIGIELLWTAGKIQNCYKKSDMSKKEKKKKGKDLLADFSRGKSIFSRRKSEMREI